MSATTSLTFDAIVKDMKRHEAARRAIVNSRPLLHGWRGMARMISRNPHLEVELTAGPTSCTDGKKLWIKVPAAMSEDLTHDINLCQQRDEYGAPRCHACDVIEEVNIHVIHEVAHIIFGTFEDVTEHEKSSLIQKAILSECANKPDSKRAQKLTKIIQEAPPEKTRDYLNLSDLVSEYLPFLINACEDIRVNTLMIEDRPGTRKMFDAQLSKIFRDGTVDYDGSRFEWRDAPPNAQAGIGVFCKVGGFDWRNALLPDIVERLDDPGLDAICERMKTTRSIRDVYRLSFPLLEELRRLGFMLTPDEPEDDPQTPSMNQEPDEEEGSNDDNGQPGDSGGEDGPPGPQPSESEDVASDETEGGSESSDGSSSEDPGEDRQDRQEAPSDDGGDGDPGDGSDGVGDDLGSSDSVGDQPGESGSGSDEPGEGDPSEDLPSTDDSPSEGTTAEAGEDPADAGEPEGGSDAGEDSAGDDASSSDEDSGDAASSDGDAGSSSSEDSDDGTAAEASDDSGDGSPGGDGVGQGQVPGEDSESESGVGEGESEEGLSGERSEEPSGSDASTEAPANGLDDTSGEPTDSPGSPQDGPGQPPDSAPVPSAMESDSGPDTAVKDSDEEDSGGGGTYTRADQERDGLPEEVEHLFKVFGQHEEATASPSEATEEYAEEEVMRIALEQIDFFDAPSLIIEGVDIFRHEDNHRAFGFGRTGKSSTSIEIPSGCITSSLTRLRLVFQDNMRGRKDSDLRRGKVDTRVLAKRVPTGDDRLFKKNTQPGRKDYFVIVGIDCSGSTAYPYEPGSMAPRLDLMKMAVAAKAEMLSRLAIPFALYAHSGGHSRVEIFEIKSDREPWGKKQRQALADLQPYSANLDGHTLEFYRKVAERRTETDRLILYYTDGAMPAANKKEELEILQREIETCKRLGIHLVGIGVNSDSPKEHGLDTLLLDKIEDVKEVVKGLQERLAV